ncbi:hypothetical protein CHS0354_039291 [Potamilus streckersoni]|uniref:Uncharacterized protein n=1 Tax=Potamilus streckersoni TaxID=2493646 RepID=A0AAE0RMW7_9BIVA|nr:hypothetical protein CHS0354_039291 [Potamilus streckersoni]
MKDRYTDNTNCVRDEERKRQLNTVIGDQEFTDTDYANDDAIQLLQILLLSLDIMQKEAKSFAIKQKPKRPCSPQVIASAKAPRVEILDSFNSLGSSRYPGQDRGMGSSKDKAHTRSYLSLEI